MKLPVFELKINDSLSDDSEVTYVALVDEPAIQKDFLAFNDQFVDPRSGETEDEFLSRCISYAVNEGNTPEQAAAICYSKWENKYAANKISFDYDGVLSTDKGKELAKTKIAEGNTIYIISARSDKESMIGTATELGIPEGRVYATGSNSEKINKIKELQIGTHYDNNPDVVSALEGIGNKFISSDIVFDSQTKNKAKANQPLRSMKFSIMDEEKRIISGPLMISDELIYRNNDKFGEHYVKFTADTIKAIAIKFAKRKYQDNVNLMHDPGQKVDGVVMFESWLVDKERGILPMQGFEDVANGSWFGSFYVENEEVWQRVKSGEFRGFSVEGLFDYQPPKSYEEEMLTKIKNLLYS